MLRFWLPRRGGEWAGQEGSYDSLGISPWAPWTNLCPNGINWSAGLSPAQGDSWRGFALLQLALQTALRRHPHTAGTQATSLLWALSWMLKPSENVWVCGMIRVTRSYRYVESWESLATSPSPQQLSAHLSPLIFLFLSRILLGLGVARGSEDGVVWPVTQLHLGLSAVTSQIQHDML